mgnify:CR=1 FL=1
MVDLAGWYVSRTTPCYVQGVEPATVKTEINRIVADQSSTHVRIVSDSWGLCEPVMSASIMGAENTALQLAAAAGPALETGAVRKLYGDALAGHAAPNYRFGPDAAKDAFGFDEAHPIDALDEQLGASPRDEHPRIDGDAAAAERGPADEGAEAMRGHHRVPEVVTYADLRHRLA